MSEKVKAWKSLFAIAVNRLQAPHVKQLSWALGLSLCLGIGLGFYPSWFGAGEVVEPATEAETWRLSQWGSSLAGSNPERSRALAKQILSRPFEENQEASLWALEHLAWLNLQKEKADWGRARGYLYDLAALGGAAPGLWLELGKHRPAFSVPPGGVGAWIASLQEKNNRLHGLLARLAANPKIYLDLQRQAWELALEIERGTAMLEALAAQEEPPTA